MDETGSIGVGSSLAAAVEAADTLAKLSLQAVTLLISELFNTLKGLSLNATHHSVPKWQG